jgi:hypothetical protein
MERVVRYSGDPGGVCAQMAGTPAPVALETDLRGRAKNAEDYAKNIRRVRGARRAFRGADPLLAERGIH